MAFYTGTRYVLLFTYHDTQCAETHTDVHSYTDCAQGHEVGPCAQEEEH